MMNTQEDKAALMSTKENTINYEEACALRAGTTRLIQEGDWSYLVEYSNERLLTLAQSKTQLGTSADAERIMVVLEVRKRRLMPWPDGEAPVTEKWE